MTLSSAALDRGAPAFHVGGLLETSVHGLRRAVFLDRDGVINKVAVRDGKPYPPPRLEDFELLPGVEEACALLRARGFLLVVVTNQPDVGRGTQVREVVEQMHARLLELLPIDRVEVCFDPGQGAPSEFRKPRPGMLLRAAAELGINLRHSYMVGDRWRDVDCGHSAGCATIFIDNGYAEELRLQPHFRAADLLEAARLICSEEIEAPLPLDFANLFPRPAPLEIDLGSGNGAFLIAMAAMFPGRNFIGVERLARRSGKTCKAARRKGLRNVRVVHAEIAEVVGSLPACSVAVFHLLFPDPWPKRRHHVRRLINDRFLRAAWIALQEGGELRFVTDDRSYYEQARKLLPAHPFQERAWVEIANQPRTEFEERYLAEGRPVYRLRLQRTEGI